MLSSLTRTLVYASFFFLPFPFIRVVSNLSISDIFIFLTFLTIVISKSGRAFLSERVVLKNEFIIPLFIFTIGFFISVENSHQPLESITAFAQIVFIFVIAYPVLVEAIKHEKQVEKIAVLLIIPGVVISILMILISIIGMNLGIDLLAYEGWRGRLSYGGMEPNIPGRILLQNIPLIAYFAVMDKRKSIKVTCIVLIVIQLTAIMLTSSRSNFLTFLFGGMLFLYFSIKFGKRIKLRYTMYALMLGIVIVTTFYTLNPEFFESPFERYKTILDAKKSASSMERLRVIDMGFTHINKNPVIGLGLGNSYLYTKVNLHNPILLTWLENGLLGMIGFSSLYFILLLQAYKVSRFKFHGSYLLLALTVVVIMMVFGDMFMANSYKRVLWVPSLLFFAYSKNVVLMKKTEVLNVQEH